MVTFAENKPTYASALDILLKQKPEYHKKDKWLH